MIIVFNPAANPSAGPLRRTRLWRVLDLLAASGVRIELHETRHRGHGTEIARAAAAAGAPTIVAAGGDGTIAEVAQGLLGSPCRLGVIPLGTANVLAHEFSLPFAPRAVAAALGFGRTRPLWAGLARSEAGERVFVQMIGAGFDAEVVHRVSPALKRRLGRGAYVLGALRELPRYRFRPIRLRLDGEEIETGSVVVCKGRLYGGPYRLAAAADPSRPGFSVALFDHAGPWATLLCGAALPLDLLDRTPFLRVRRAMRVEILGPAPTPAQSDGDPSGRLPLAISDAPAPIALIVG